MFEVFLAGLAGSRRVKTERTYHVPPGDVAGNDMLAVSSFYPDLELATTGVHWLTGLPLVGAQILVALLARSSSDKTRLTPPS